MNKEDSINYLIQNGSTDTGKISDGFHTFDELYEQRVTLYITLCRILSEDLNNYVWRSKIHSDGTTSKGWFILGINEQKSIQMTFHLPVSKWKETKFAHTRSSAPEWDRHTSKDVLKRLKNL